MLKFSKNYIDIHKSIKLKYLKTEFERQVKDRNNSYEITINGFQVRKINEIRNVIFGLRYGKPSSAFRPKLGCSPS